MNELMNGSCHISRIKYWIIPILDLPLQYLAIISAAKSSPRLDQLHKNQGGGRYRKVEDCSATTVKYNLKIQVLPLYLYVLILYKSIFPDRNAFLKHYPLLKSEITPYTCTWASNVSVRSQLSSYKFSCWLVIMASWMLPWGLSK